MSWDLAPRPISRKQKRPRLLSRKFALVMGATFAYFVAIGATLPILPRYIESQLDGGGLEVGIGVGSFAVSAALLRPWIGRMGDRHGRRVLAFTGAATAGVSFLAYGIAGSLPLLVLARLVTGAGEAAFFTGVLTANQDLAPDDRRGEAASYFSVALYGGLAVGPPAGEALLRATSFGTAFVMLSLCCFLATVLSGWVPVGQVRDANSPVPERKILHPAAVWPGIILTLGLVPMVAFASFLPLFADRIGFDDVGPVMALYAGSVLVVRIFGARLPDTLGWRRASTLALSGVASGLGIMGLGGSAPAIWLGAVLLAFGMSMLYPALLVAVMGATPETERSHAVGTFTLFFDLAQGVSATLVGGVVSLSGERTGFVVAGLCAVMGLVAQTALRSRIGRPVGSVRPATYL